MYRQLLHTECKPGLRLSRTYEGTDAQKKVVHMPWWEQGVETSKKMVISYDNLIVRLWLNGAIMPYTDGGYAEAHYNNSVPKDDIDDESQDLRSKEVVGKDGHIDTLIDSKGLPPIPHPYWVDRLGFQQTDPVTDFRSGGVLSLAMLVHIVEACPNVHARFLPSGDTHMLPFGITCINVTDMIAKFCMFSKSVDKMDALLSQKPFWRMFENPDSLLVLQELSMEILCNVVVEMGRERKIPKERKGANSDIDGQEHQQEVTVFDFAEILYRTEKRVNDDLLGAGPRNVDELRAIHTRNCTKYMKALEKKEEMALKSLERSNSMSALPSLASGGKEKFAILASAKNTTTESAKQFGIVANSVIGNASNVANNVIGTAGNVIENAGGVLNKFKEFGIRPTTPGRKNSRSKENYDVEEVDFAKAPQPSHNNDQVTDSHNEQQGISDGATRKGGKESEVSQTIEAGDLFAFLDDDVEDKTEIAKKKFEELLSESTSKRDVSDYFTIDDDDLL
jgi:hypothetical protein